MVITLNCIIPLGIVAVLVATWICWSALAIVPDEDWL